ncbi:hypothetical protein F972_02839 [Acinetobacter sp. CIP 102529]|uniref:Uncharacterized protein n=1 Tax=Acinetobacter parvus DSM 16617 = CIP 108168 TaxID=981333 RepID=N8QGN4_9GAMM|nr:hypothetical protein F988_00046 [Acinetobacter parvus DSM 16617 = CIP 108168]ENU87958.1 hypothetical protein F972_02839 [Acinetobacter sp. CIP 102529]
MHYHGKVCSRHHRFLFVRLHYPWKEENKKVTKSLKDIGSVNILKYFTIIYGLPYHEQQLGLEGPIQ